jgi:hypothetical protein
MQHVLGRKGVHTGFWWETSDGKGPLLRPCRRWEQNNGFLKVIWKVQTGFIWLRRETSGGIFVMYNIYTV